MGKIRIMSDEQALNSRIPSKWEAIRTNWGDTADAGPPEVIDFAESNDANVAKSVDVTDCTILLCWGTTDWCYTFTEKATPIGYDSTWINAGGEYAVHHEDESDKRAMWVTSSFSQLVVPAGAKFINYRPVHKSGVDRVIVIAKT